MAKKPDTAPAEKKARIYTAELEDLIRGKSPLEAQRIIAAFTQKARYGRNDAVITAAHLDDGLSFIDVEDLGYQWAMQRPGYAAGKIQSLIGFEGASKTSKQLWLANLAMKQGGQAAGVFVEHADSTTHMRNYIAPEFLDLFTCHIAETFEEGIEMTYNIQRDWEFQDKFFVDRKKEIKERLKDMLPKVKKLTDKQRSDNDPIWAEHSALTVELGQVELYIKGLKRVQIFDSIAGATQEKLLKDDAEPGAPKPGGIGGIMSDFVNAMKTRIRRTSTLWAVNNQARSGIPIGWAAQAAAAHAPEIEKLVAKGGKALPFHASFFEVIDKNGSIKSEDKVIEGFEATLTFKKNKYGVPMRKVHYNVEWGKGLAFMPHTLEQFVQGKILGLASESVRGKGKMYWAKDIGVSKASSLNDVEMYELIHSPEIKPRFQQVLGIITDTTQVAELSGDEAMDEPIEDAADAGTESADVPPPGEA